MKTRAFFQPLIILSALALPGLLNAAIPDEKQTRQVGSFTAISVSSGIELTLQCGLQEIVVVEGDHKDAVEIVTEVKDGTLHIYRKNKSGFNLDFHNDCEVHVTAKMLTALDASAGSEVKAANQFSGKEMSVTASSGSEVTLDLAYEKLKADCSSGSEINLKGKTQTLNVSVSSGSEIKACELTAGIVHADASSGGEACVNAISELHANASSGGEIEYKGAPQVVDVHKSSGGSISKE